MPPATHDTTLRERLAGAIERVTFHSEQSGFCVLRVKVRGQRDLMTAIGSAVSVSAGESIEAHGQWVNDRDHGLQFCADQLRVVPPTTLEGIEKYLGSGMVKGIGPHFARKLVRAFGEAVFDVIETTPPTRGPCGSGGPCSAGADPDRDTPKNRRSSANPGTPCRAPRARPPRGACRPRTGWAARR
jgi:hypothetical protein